MLLGVALGTELGFAVGTPLGQKLGTALGEEPQLAAWNRTGHCTWE